MHLHLSLQKPNLLPQSYLLPKPKEKTFSYFALKDIASVS